jgi:hypothetical protein
VLFEIAGIMGPFVMCPVGAPSLAAWPGLARVVQSEKRTGKVMEYSFADQPIVFAPGARKWALPFARPIVMLFRQDASFFNRDWAPEDRCARRLAMGV